MIIYVNKLVKFDEFIYYGKIFYDFIAKKYYKRAFDMPFKIYRIKFGVKKYVKRE